jgi:toxin ParE1/3/4
MNRYIIEITETAGNDLREIRRYIAEELLELVMAVKIVDMIGEAVISLEDMPLRNALVNDDRLSDQGIRKLIIKNYVIFYIAEEKNSKVTVIRILSSRRDWMNLI